VQATRLALQAIGRVKGCASRGGESGVGHEQEHEHEHEEEDEDEDEGPNVYNCVSLSERQAGALALQRDFRSSILSYSILFAACSLLLALCPSGPGDEAELVVLL
jgi:hypothetical protein